MDKVDIIKDAIDKIINAPLDYQNWYNVMNIIDGKEISAGDLANNAECLANWITDFKAIEIRSEAESKICDMRFMLKKVAMTIEVMLE